MPVSLQQFFNSANTVGDSASLFLQNGGESVGDTSSLHGIHKLSRSAKAEENRATVTAFLNALEQSPQFRNINADIRGMLNAKLEGGKPLTAEDVKLVRDSVLYDEALAAGRQLADGNALPAGHATSFAQFALVRNLDRSPLWTASTAFLSGRMIFLWRWALRRGSPPRGSPRLSTG